MDVFVARQPLLDPDKDLAGYELLFRSSLDTLFQGAEDGNTATAEVINHAFVLIGKRELTGKLKAFVNFTPDLILRGVPELLSADDVVVELLSDGPPSDDLLEACRRLTDAGYWLVLDDYVGAESAGPLLDMARYVKVDVQTMGVDRILDCVERVAPHGVEVIAKRVESDEQYQACKGVGCTLFQGFHFARPQVVRGLSPRSGRSMNLLSLMAELNQPDFDLDRAQRLIRTDASLSYKLLRYLNSAFFSLPREVHSVQQAVMLLGSSNVRKFCSIVFLSQVGMKRPDELLKNSIQRARFCELLAPERAQEAFTLGLLSLIDVLVGAPMDEVLEGLPLAGELRLALAEDAGPLAPYLGLVRAYEKADWIEVSKLARRLKVDESAFPSHYSEAVGWADAMFDLDAP